MVAMPGSGIATSGLSAPERRIAYQAFLKVTCCKIPAALLTNTLVDPSKERLEILNVCARRMPRRLTTEDFAMPPKKSATLTEAELRIMKLLWQRGESAVSDLVAAIPEGDTLAYNSVLTTIRILEEKRYVRHRQEGRAFIYRACVGENDASKVEVRHVLQRFFGNSREKLLLSLLGDEEITPPELQRLRDAIRGDAIQGDAIRDASGEASSNEEGEDAGRWS
jgi:predicted transcriptional regulator